MAVSPDARRFESWRAGPPRRRESGPTRGPTLYPSPTTGGGIGVSGVSPNPIYPLFPARSRRTDAAPKRPNEHDTRTRRTHRLRTASRPVRRRTQQRGRRRARPERRRVRGAGVPEHRRSPVRRPPAPRPARRLSAAPPGAHRGRRMTTDRRLERRTGREGRRFMRKPRKGTSRRNPRLSKIGLGEGRGGRFHPERLDTYAFSRLRCKPTASALAAGLCSGAGVAGRRAIHEDTER